MTEQEWLQSDNPHEMLMWFRENWRGLDADLEHLMRRYWLVCCRRIWKLILNKDSRRSLKVLERFLDGTATIEELEAAEWKAEGALMYIQYQQGLQKIARWVKEIGDIPPDELRSLVRRTHHGDELSPDEILWQAARFAHRALCNLGINSGAAFWSYKPFLSASLLREVIGNPFRPLVIDPAWVTEDAIVIAKSMYNEDLFVRMPILGDKLEEAGCTDLSILDHCRGPVEHVRGCWVIDSLLGKP